MSDIKRLHVAARFSDTAVFNGVVYLAGQVPTDPAQDMAGQDP
jgi:enamine deaminase RidA (YjgF/YER057c/UK114 family)